MVSFQDNGGVINGNAPVVEGAGGGGSTITQILLEPAGTGGQNVLVGEAHGQGVVVLKWRGPAGHDFVVEMSGDFQDWEAVPCEIVEFAPGDYETRFPAPVEVRQFFRLSR